MNAHVATATALSTSDSSPTPESLTVTTDSAPVSAPTATTRLAEEAAAWLRFCQQVVDKGFVTHEERTTVLAGLAERSWRRLLNMDGTRFDRFEDLCAAPRPFGLARPHAEVNEIVRQVRTCPPPPESGTGLRAHATEAGGTDLIEPSPSSVPIEPQSAVRSKAKAGAGATPALPISTQQKASKVGKGAAAREAKKNGAAVDENASQRLEALAIDVLDAHPRNPRLAPHPETLSGLVEQMKKAGAFDRTHAIKVRVKGGGRYEILSGHQRVEAARQAELATVWAFVVEATDDEAYMMLILANTQEPPSKLEVALHALGVVDEKSKDSIAGYARKVGLQRENLSRYMRGARVFEAIRQDIGPDNAMLLRDRADHLARIAKAPKGDWAPLATQLAKEQWSIKDTEVAVKQTGATGGHDDRQTRPSDTKVGVEAMRGATGADDREPSGDPDHEHLVQLLTRHAETLREIQTFLGGMPAAPLMKAIKPFVEGYVTTGVAPTIDTADLLARRAVYGRVTKLQAEAIVDPEVAAATQALNPEGALRNPDLTVAHVDRLAASFDEMVAPVDETSPIEQLLGVGGTEVAE